MKRYVVVVLMFFLIGVVKASVVDEHPEIKPLANWVGDNLSVLHLVGFRATEIAMKELGFEKGDYNILVLTDAGYVAKIGNYTTERALDGVMIASGCSRGKNNLVNVHRPYNAPLWFAFFDRRSKDCVYLEVNSSVLKMYLDEERVDRERALSDFMKLRDDEIFSKVSKENIDANRLLKNPNEWQEKMKEKVFGGNEFSIITIANLWAKGLSSEYIRVAELHDHVCPGLISGFMIAEYLKKHFPSENPRFEYYVIAIPPWCKDDALIQIFETNVGHRRMFVKWITDEQRKELPGNAKNVANIVVRWKDGKGEGIVLTFDWDKADRMCGINGSDFRDFKSYKWWWARLKMDMLLIDYVDRPEEFVKEVKRFEVKSPSEFYRLASAGVNPLEEIGLIKSERQKVVQVVPAWTYAVIGVLVIVIVAMGAYIAKLKR